MARLGREQGRAGRRGARRLPARSRPPSGCGRPRPGRKHPAPRKRCPSRLRARLPSEPEPQSGYDPGSARVAEAPLRLPHTDWLHHRLCVTGPVSELDGFRQAASGAGRHPVAARFRHPRGGLVPPADRPGPPRTQPCRQPGARRPAARGGLSTAMPWPWRKLAGAGPARSTCTRLCRFPRPSSVLVPTTRRALAWLWQHWGTTEGLRHVRAAAGRAGSPIRRFRPGWGCSSSASGRRIGRRGGRLSASEPPGRR